MKIGIDYIGVAVGVIVINEKNEVALLKRKFAPEKDSWCLAGGKVKLNEKMEDACVRECNEELDIDIIDVELIGVNDYIVPNENQHWVSITFFAKAYQGKPVNKDKAHSDLKWFDIYSLPNNLTFCAKDSMNDYKKLLKDKVLKIVNLF